MAKTKEKNGGDVGFQEVTQLDKFFADKVAKLPVGGITSEVIVSPYGFHIFKVSAKENKGFYKLSEVKDTLKQLLSEDRSEQVVNDWLANGREHASIVISPELKVIIASNKLPKRPQ